MVSADARATPPRTRAARRRGAVRRRPRPRWRDRRKVDRAWRRASLRGPAGAARRDVRDRRNPGLLLVLPALDSWPPPPRLTGVAGAAASSRPAATRGPL